MITYDNSSGFIPCWRPFQLSEGNKWTMYDINVKYQDQLRIWAFHCNISLQKYDANINLINDTWILNFMSEEGHTLFLLEYS